MATLEEQIKQEQEKLRRAETALASVKEAAKLQGKDSTPAIKKATAAVQRSRKTLTELRAKNAKVEADRKEAEKTPEEKQKAQASAARESLPFPVNDALFNELKNAVGGNLSIEAFNQGGVGAGIFVYQGQKTGTGKSPTGGVYKSKVDDVALANNVINSFWTDKGIQKKVTSALIAAGNPNATQLDAFATWQGVVQQSANLYAAGKGPKFTPMDILNMSMTKAVSKPDVSVYVDVPRDAELKQILKSRISNWIQYEPKDDDPTFQALFNEVKGLYQKGETVTTTTDASGKKTQKRTGGVTDALIQSKIQAAYDKNNVDFLENKSLEGADLFSQWIRS